MALKHFALAEGGIVTAKEISEKHNIPYELLAKILQKLKKDKVLSSIQGTKGGYQLLKKPDEIDLFFLMHTIDGDMALTECQCSHNENGKCTLKELCTIKQPVTKMQKEIEAAAKQKA